MARVEVRPLGRHSIIAQHFQRAHEDGEGRSARGETLQMRSVEIAGWADDEARDELVVVLLRRLREEVADFEEQTRVLLKPIGMRMLIEERK